MQKYIFNVFSPCLMLIKYVSFTTSAIDKHKFSHSLRDKVLSRSRRVALDTEQRLKDCESSSHDWTVLAKPHILIKVIMDYHLIGLPFFLSMVTQSILLGYMLIKCLFHILRTGTDNELARHYDRVYFFPRMFESHERPDLFYGHCLVIVLYMASVRSIAFYRLVKMSVVNRDRYSQVSVSQLNYSYLGYIYLSAGGWLRLIQAGLRHHFGFRYRDDPQKLTDHLHFDGGVLHDAVELGCHDLIYYVNQIDFERCYKTDYPSLHRVEHKAAGRLHAKSHLRRCHTTRPLHRVDITELAFLAGCYATIIFLLCVGFFVVVFCSLYFELAGAIREKHNGAVMSIVDTLRYLPEWLQEPRRLIRLSDLLVLALIQLPNQFDAAVYFTDATMLISRAYKVMVSLEQDRVISNTYMGETEIGPEQLVGLALDARKEFQLSLKEEENLNRRLIERIRLSQVLKAEFQDLKQTHTLYLNTMIFFSGLSISYSISLIILSTNFSTRIAIGLNAFIEIAPMTVCMVLSAVLNNMFKGINKNLHLLVINTRSNLTERTIKYLMIECSAFETTRERSIQIAGTFSITPQSLGPLVAYISTCILFLTNKFKMN